ncbi:MAG: MarR family winged helix-turn-helix transcriptional regulator [Arachnia sp.]
MSEPRWLNDEEDRAWVALSAVLMWLPGELDAQLARDSDLRYVEYLVLSGLSMAPGRAARMGAIAELSNINPSHLSRVAARLEARGWLRREPAPDDGRATIAMLTDAGWEKVVEAAPGHVEQVRRLVFEQLGPEQVAALGDIAQTIAQALRPGLGCPGTGEDDGSCGPFGATC